MTAAAAAAAAAGYAGYAADPAVPGRDVLLDPDAVSDRLSSRLGRSGPLTIESCRLVRAKYRIGESMRVVHRVVVDGTSHLVTARTFASGHGLRAFEQASRTAIDVGPLRGVTRDVDLDAVWWTFPNDRRLASLAAVVGDGERGAGGEVVAYAPERSLTLRLADPSGATRGYAKVYRRDAVDVVERARRYDAIAAALAARGGGRVGSPRAIEVDPGLDLVVLEPLAGVAWTAIDDRAAPEAMFRLGQAIATVHTLRPPPGCPSFGRLEMARVQHSAALVARARPDVADVVGAVAQHLARTAPPPDRPVLLHGDCHPGNALFTVDRVNLIDFDQAGIGSPAADIGSLLARLRQGECTGERDPATTSAMASAFLSGYEAVRPLPSPASVRWHTTAAIIAERALRAVNRVHRPTLERLPELLEAVEP